MMPTLANASIIEDISSSKQDIINCINRHGSAREHNYWFFHNQQTSYSRPYFFKFGDFGAFGIRYHSGIWEFIGDVIAPASKRAEIFEDFLDYVLTAKKDKKVLAFVNENFWISINNMAKDSDKYRITTTKPIIYYTPVFDMSRWDNSLGGKEWKKLRNIKNRFMKSNDVQIVPSTELDKKDLIGVIHGWRKKKPNKDEKTYYTEMYENFVKNDFEGTDLCRSIVVNGKPLTITAGWKIPNSDAYHSAIGLYNYGHKHIAEMANIDELSQIKSFGCRYADFGDSTESLLQFKKKFRPSEVYKTYWFYIARK